MPQSWTEQHLRLLEDTYPVIQLQALRRTSHRRNNSNAPHPPRSCFPSNCAKPTPVMLTMTGLRQPIVAWRQIRLPVKCCSEPGHVWALSNRNFSALVRCSWTLACSPNYGFRAQGLPTMFFTISDHCYSPMSANRTCSSEHANIPRLQMLYSRRGQYPGPA
ncbi:hypothetical protein P154DRAFT_333960 [Amniculicola lignicola CBS 123094]|uniref:Uncharacterized protein n=1 Tax=Amniculicola lignicola CBS 123094 TaxID=1392246 RepID=A0A6A5W419_9PLEO|nr:hypothetical protein P154DRAFT_333960 [Amniculicola lignicola CBS 123094]